MENYKVQFIKETTIDVTNQKIISVGIIEPYDQTKPEPGKLNMSAIMSIAKMLYLKVASNSEYAQQILDCYLNDKTLYFDKTSFLIIPEVENNIKRKYYYHESVSKDHLIKIDKPFFNVQFEKSNNEIRLFWNDEIATSSIDIALRDILIYLNYNQEKLVYSTAESEGILKISVGQYYREFSAEEITLQKARKLPRHEVLIESNGFSFYEIKQALNNFQNMLPEYVTSRFHYSVDFLNLILRG